VFAGADSFFFYRPPGQALGLLPAIEISGLGWIERRVRRQAVKCSYHGIGCEIEGVPTPWFAHFRLDIAPLYIWIDKATDEWREQALRRFCIVWRRPPEEGDTWLASGLMRRFDRPTVVPPRLGRNDPCPCNSGLKFKRCHGAGVA
jgi:hypothetical protein